MQLATFFLWAGVVLAPFLWSPLMCLPVPAALPRLSLPYWDRVFLSASCLSSPVFADPAGGCLDALDLLPAGSVENDGLWLDASFVLR